MKAIVRTRGRITIPAELRKKLKIKGRTWVWIYEEDGEVVLMIKPKRNRRKN